jgi:hypothetical protein
METTTVEATVVEPVVERTTTIALEPKMETQIDPQPCSSTEVVVRETVVEEVAPLRSAPMLESRPRAVVGLELLDDELIDLAVVSLNMEFWRHTEQWSRYATSTPSTLVVMSTSVD